MASSDTKGLDLKTLGTLLGVIGALAGTVGNYMITEHKVEVLEADNAKKTQEIKDLKAALAKQDREHLRMFNEMGEEMKCLICAAHKYNCPGCGS